MTELPTLTPREERVSDLLRRPVSLEAIFLIVAALIGAGAGGWTYAGCHPPTGPPEGALGGYCARSPGSASPLLYVVGALGLALIVRLGLGKLRHPRRLALAVVLLAALADVIVIVSLPAGAP